MILNPPLVQGGFLERLVDGTLELAHDLIEHSLKYEIRVQHRLRWTPQKGSAEVLELPSESLSNVAHFRNPQHTAGSFMAVRAI